MAAEDGLPSLNKRGEARAEYQRLWQLQHKDKVQQHARDYHARHKDDPAYREMKNRAAKFAKRKAKYGLSKDQYLALLTAQNGTCNICGSWRGEDLRVDHDHDTGKVRSLLCEQCNSGLGMFKEDPERLRKAIEYLDRHRDKGTLNGLDLRRADGRLPQPQA